MSKGKRTFQPNTRRRRKAHGFLGANELEERTARAEAAPGQGTQAPDRQQRIAPVSRAAGLRSEERIRRRADFQQVYEHGARVHGRYSTVFVLPNNQAVGRLGIAATKKLGGAVQRNRAKRLIREIFRRNKIAPGLDVVVVPRRELLEASLTAIEADYRSTLERRLRQRR